ncbi:NDP-sugar epimerase, includes UDP-GlcNAc-inverting 4,6-dehydratase FlaA1 and capsular polysaccharide biosynthesis protein EpsC [Desulfotomaculum arcticum]|uniref:NDP-sugar epimerase, includes UDP-GlcNAc-inverting 4,6-dehydratase FlaA1 and capsular polysaccharide biosynthesis protein EpsC n=1 Tax=Desulfotruncus arcticus DSM 17038 TaxID=1121424 RepID=A0A1I2X3A8_9FIRM|nr:nucleoside-diphosphate sugar epimerase/dehydratase [Desulfotruncus arcticus]SFH07409.1 NDP-sugar epimerase, includes UDP-GlcNAc-inverting 4,6-dehydratase FlaA1 and capsular polysaccharide biosynthesis protein EpsC [Desulfotomaculum arcticum] [Desulfotruncus arcticus DSM 17038]
MNFVSRTAILLFCDFVLVNLAMVLTLLIRFYESGNALYYLQNYINFAPLAAGLMIISFYLFRLYNKVWAYASIGELVTIATAVSTGTAGVFILSFFIQTPLPRSVVLMSWAFNILIIGGSRCAWRVYVKTQKTIGQNNGYKKEKKKALIVGAGDAGAMVARELQNHDNGLVPVGFVDDDVKKHGMTILGIPVLGGRDRLPAIIKERIIAEVIIAMPSVPGEIIRQTVQTCKSANVRLKILPGIYQLINGKVTASSLRTVQVEDLLGRDPVRVNMRQIAGYLTGRTVMVTGAGGSIGSELCRQVAGFAPSRLIVLGHGENTIHNIVMELWESHHDLTIDIEIADVRDKQKIDSIFELYKPSVVFHAAAHKHVPLMERHPDEAVKTNVFGTRNVAEAADRVGTDIFVMISTDKAVNPSSVMGATKRLAELVVQHLNKMSRTTFTAVRFGNVLGSSGSVVPTFKRQILRGGPVTVTHPEMKRYFMTIPEAVQLVIQAGAMAEGGEVFVLDMGEPVKIIDLARLMITLSGLEPGKDIEIKFSGVRPGEKLFEELLTAEEGSDVTKHERIFVARPTGVDFARLEAELHRLWIQNSNGRIASEDVFEVLINLIPNFRHYRKEWLVG